MLTLQYETRDSKAKPGKVRSDGKIPAVFYGPKEKSTPISVAEGEFKKVWKVAGESSIIVLKHGDAEHEALIHEVDTHPVSGAPLHADFYVIEKGKKLQVSVPLEFVGVSPAVKDLGGLLIKVMHELEIEAMPKDLPHDIKVDISSLAALDSQLLVKDIKLPEGVTMIANPEEVVAAIDVAKEEVEEPAKTIDDIEVVGAKGKEEAEGEGAEAAKSDDKKAPEKK